MKNEIGIFLTQQGFFAGKRLQNGTLQMGAHKISEDEIFQMFGALVRTWKTKTGQDTIVLPGNDGKIIVAKLVEIKDAAGQQDAAPQAEGQAPGNQEQAAADAAPKKKRARKARKASE